MNQPKVEAHGLRGHGLRRIAGVSLIVVGVLLLVTVGTYYALGLYFGTKLPEYNASVNGPVALPEVPSGQPEVYGVLTSDGTFKPLRTVVRKVDTAPTIDTALRQRAPASSEGQSPEPTSALTTRQSPPTPGPATVAAQTGNAPSGSEVPPPGSADLVAAYNSIYPGFRMHPKYWDQPLIAGTDSYTFGVILRPDGFVSLSASQGIPNGEMSDAVHIRIPSIGVDSAVDNLAILELGDSRQYETPSHVVGRIPQTSNPGEQGNTWLFGHLESPIRGEGNVFQRLPDIPALLEIGDPVYVSLENEDGDEYLYQVVATEVVYKDDLTLYDTEDSTITLVACVPRLVYDHRILVTGKLVGVKKAPA